MNLNCGFVKNTGLPCGESSGVAYNGNARLFVCSYHRSRLNEYRDATAGAQVAEAIDLDPTYEHSRGETYSVLTVEGLVKIGYAGASEKITTDQALAQRWSKVSRLTGGRCEVLSVRPGGRTMEALAHYRLRSSRVMFREGEYFWPTPEVLRFANDGSMTEAGSAALDRFAKWRPRESS